MKILLISPLYYPYRSPNVYRWDAIAKHWSGQGHEIHWLCTRFGNEPDVVKVNDIFIHRTGYNTLLDWVSDAMGIRKKRGTLGTGKPRQNRLRKFIEQIIHLTWRKIYWPDGSCLWFFPAKRKAFQLMDSHNFDAIISVSLPFTAVLIASSVKKKYPLVRWLMDIEDPFSFVEEYFINNRALYKDLNNRQEQLTLQLADKVSVTVESARQRYLACFQFEGAKISVTPPLFEKIEVEEEVTKMVNMEKDKINLGYFGTFYYPIRSPEGLLCLLQEAIALEPAIKNKVVFHFAGEIPLEYADLFGKYPDLKSMLHFYGLISRGQVASMMKEVDILVNIGNETNYHLPSKSAEYLMSGKPIVNVACSVNDAFALFLDKYPLFLNLVLQNHNPGPAEARKLLEFIRSHLKNV